MNIVGKAHVYNFDYWLYLFNNDFYFIMMSVICFVVSTYGVVFSVTFDI
jgi:hypothetical protein